MPRRTKQEALQTRHALLDAAERVFAERGVAATSLQDVAAAAGVTRGAVYWHFRDKADLYVAMMDRATLPFEQHWLAVAANDRAAPLQRLQDLLFDILHRTATDARLQRALAISTQKVEYVGELDAARERHLRVRAQALQRFEGLLQRAAARGQRRHGVSAATAARGLHALVSGLIDNWMLDPGAFDLQRVGRAAVRQMLAGLGDDDAPAPRSARRSSAA